MFPAPISQYQSPRILHHLHVPALSDPPPPVSILLDSRSPLISSSRIKPRHTQHFTTTLERSTTNSADLNFAHYNYHCYLPSSHCIRSFCLSPGGSTQNWSVTKSHPHSSGHLFSNSLWRMSNTRPSSCSASYLHLEPKENENGRPLEILSGW